MALWRVMFLLVVLLLAVKVQYVSCPGDTWLRTATLASHLDTSALTPLPDRNDICDNHTVSCQPAESSAAKAVVDFNAAVSCFFFIVPMIRVLRLEHNSRTESDTQFWWYLCYGSSGYIVWVYYFSGCSSFQQAAVFPIYMVSMLGAIVHLILLLIATCLTFGVRDRRPIPLVFVPAASFGIAALLWVSGLLDWIRWLGFSLTALSHCFRLGATNYQDDFTFWLFDASIPIWLVNAIISAVGAVSGFLWLRHPQLCVSLEYKGRSVPQPNPSQQHATNATSQAMVPASDKQRKGKRPVPPSIHTNSSANSSYIQSSNKKQKVSKSNSRAIAEASAKAAAGGTASITIETSAGMVAGTYAKATINVSGATGTAKIRSTSTGHGNSLGKHNVIIRSTSTGHGNSLGKRNVIREEHHVV